MAKVKAKSATARKRLGVGNAERTQDVRDRYAFKRFLRKHPQEAMEWIAKLAREVEPDTVFTTENGIVMATRLLEEAGYVKEDDGTYRRPERAA